MWMPIDRLRYWASTHIHTRQNCLAVVLVTLACVVAFALRCLHLVDTDHYFILSPDSHYFHRMAELLVLDETFFYPTQHQALPTALFSGITYPLAYSARAITSVTNLLPIDALDLVSRFLPPSLGVLTVLVLYQASSRLYGRSVGILTAFVWALLPVAVAIQTAGYLDRDCLSILLVIAGAFSFYFLSGKSLKIGSHDFGWVFCALVTLAFEVLLYLEWGFLGSVILMAIIAAFYLLDLSNTLLPRVISAAFGQEDVLRIPFVALRVGLKALPSAIQQSPYKAMALLTGLNLMAIALRPHIIRSVWESASRILREGATQQSTIQELAGLGPGDVLAYGPLLVPIAVGLYILATRRERPDLLLLAWCAILLAGSLFARRIFIYAAPALCVIGSRGLKALLDPTGIRLSRSAISYAIVELRVVVPYLRFALAFVVILWAVLIWPPFGYSFASEPMVSVNSDWQGALSWLRQNTAEDATIMTWWHNGYWVLDVGHRTPVADNGIHPPAVDRDIAAVYVAEDDLAAVAIMAQYGADYLIFSEMEIGILHVIAERVLGESYGDGSTIPVELRNSLFARSLQSDFKSEHGLTRVYPPPDSPKPAVVIIARVDSNCGRSLV